MGKILIGVGLVLVLLGVVLVYFPAALGWFGKLPGDIRIENENSRFYFPITSMILVSVVLSVLLRFFGKP